MSQDAVAEIQRHLVSVQALAALSAALRLHQDHLDGPTPVMEGLRDVARAIHPDLPDALGPEQAAATRAGIDLALREATDLLADPAREPRWRPEDPALIQAIGQVSRGISRRSPARPLVIALQVVSGCLSARPRTLQTRSLIVPLSEASNRRLTERGDETDERAEPPSGGRIAGEDAPTRYGPARGGGG